MRAKEKKMIYLIGSYVDLTPINEVKSAKKKYQIVIDQYW